MSKPYHQLYVHCVWSTHHSRIRITPEIQEVLYPFLENKAKKFKCTILCMGGIEDHIHIALRLCPARAVSDIVGKLKGSSTYFLNKELQITTDFDWQDGYGALTFAQRDLKSIVMYIQNQKERHATGKLNSRMEYIPNPSDPEVDEW